MVVSVLLSELEAELELYDRNCMEYGTWGIVDVFYCVRRVLMAAPPHGIEESLLFG